MQIESMTIVTIVGMALVTFATRVGGFWLMRYVTLSPRIEAALRHLAGAVLISIVAPLTLTNGLPSLGATLVTALVAARTQNLLLAILSGVGAVWSLRLLF